MDPATILATIQSATQLAGTCYQLGDFLYKLRSSYKDSNSTLRSIETETRIFQAAVQHIRQWLQDQTANPSINIQLQSVDSALGLINESMKDLRSTLTKVTVRSSGTASGPWADRWMKAKLVMNEDSLKNHLQELREHARLVQFTLTTLQLYAIFRHGSHIANTKTGVTPELQRRQLRRLTRLLLKRLLFDAHILQRSKSLPTNKATSLAKLQP